MILLSKRSARNRMVARCQASFGVSGLPLTWQRGKRGETQKSGHADGDLSVSSWSIDGALSVTYVVHVLRDDAGLENGASIHIQARHSAWGTASEQARCGHPPRRDCLRPDLRPRRFSPAGLTICWYHSGFPSPS